jgi:hypothetical protein
VYFLTSTEKVLDFDVKWSRGSGPPAPILKQLLSNVLNHREDLLIEWEKKVCPR